MNNKTKRILGIILFSSPVIALYICGLFFVPIFYVPITIFGVLMFIGYKLVKSSDE